jgi:hypothetical protein
VWRKWCLASYSAPKFILCRVERERWCSEGRRTSWLVRSPRCSSSAQALPKSVWARWSFLRSGSIECGSSIRILRTLTESLLSSPSCVSGFGLVWIFTTLPQSALFANRSKSFIHFSCVICAFTYHIVELVFVLSYIQSRVWGSNEYSGTQCGDYYLVPRRLTALIRWKILHSAVTKVSEALSMHVAPPAIQIVVVSTWVTVLIGFHHVARLVWWVPPCMAWLLPLVWISCCAIGWSGSLSLSFKTVPKSKVCVCIYTIAFELSYLSLG